MLRQQNHIGAAVFFIRRIFNVSYMLIKIYIYDTIYITKFNRINA